MKVAIDASILSKTGIGNYTNRLINDLPKLFPGDVFIKVSEPVPLRRDSSYLKYINGFRRIYLEQIKMSQTLKMVGADIFHNPRNFGLPLYSPCKCVVTIHDIIPMIFSKVYLQSIVEKKYYNMSIRAAITRSAKIITDSKFSRDELIKHLGVKGDKIEVVYLGCGDEFRVIDDSRLLQQVLDKHGVYRPFIVTIGGSEYRKNIARLIDVFQTKFAEDYQLVVIGGAWRKFDLRQDRGSLSNVVFTGPVTQEELVSLYSLASLFVFPSLYEGFGLPVLEAMACGVPVAASNSSSIPEVAGDAALMFDPMDENQMYLSIKKILDSKSLQKELTCKGLEQVKLFRWEDTLRQTMQIYRDVLK